MTRDERELAAAFERLRRREMPQTPPFERVWAAARRRAAARRPRTPLRRALPATLATAALVVVALGALLLVERARWSAAPPADDQALLELARDLSTWSSPLDFLEPPRRASIATPLAPGAAERFLELLDPGGLEAAAGADPNDLAAPPLDPDSRLWEEI